MSLSSAITQLDTEFQATPLNFTVEQSLQARLQHLLRQELGETILARGGFDHDDTTNYKEKYIRRLAEPHEISSVQSEVNYGSPNANKRLDIAVLQPESTPQYSDLDYVPSAETPNLTVRFVDGTKYFPAAAITHAIEIKYIKNVDIAGSRLERDSLDEWPYLNNDLRKLAELPDTVSRHLLICTNKNPFQRGEEDVYGTTKAQRRFERVQTECDARDITLTEIHPRE
ncbi:hypothetical protein [Halapricum salinum]|uniref:Uncharacterized protein n=1 Tax=Halapricum salinum TaxID=1457250 RepID=A0A4D6HEF8_9EURY|nr:hypothetical protein [Halapricum salinum]QCC51432.1 hypothetical protein DV733_09335 [Halapricum salinum]